MILRRSATPALTALTGLKKELVLLAMTLARVVLPLPGGPQRIIEGSRPPSIAFLSTRPSPTRCFWPTNSFSVDGLIRVASGAPALDADSFPPEADWSNI